MGKYYRISALFTLLISVGISSLAKAQESNSTVVDWPAEADEVSNALANYLAKPDESYTWTKIREGKTGETEYVELLLTSQTWRTTVWKHRLFILKPSNCDASRQAMLVIAGGRWHDKYEDPEFQENLSGQAAIFSQVAKQLQSPVAVLMQVPQQPLFDGLTEDRLISLTFEKFLRSRDPEWPLLLPMVKSAVRAMDAVQDYCGKHWKVEIDSFTVTGASKRGWTTWLLGAMDRRANALAPLVIDMLNMSPQMHHQRAAWGDFSEQIDEYTDRKLQEHLDTPAGKMLQQIVDPFSYRAQITQPKLIVLGTNDRYWPLDALNLYWDELQGEKHILYIPNNRHGLRDFPRLLGGFAALHEQARGRKKMPKLSWKFDRQEDQTTLRVSSDMPVKQFQVWTATSETRDFREAQWTVVALEEGQLQHTLIHPESGYQAFFGEAIYERKVFPLHLSTNVRIVGDNPTLNAE